MNSVAENVFLTTDGRNRVVLSAKGLVGISPTKDSVNFLKVDSAKLDAATMKEYVGEYYSPEVDVKYQVQLRNGKLFLVLPPKLDLPLTATYKDGFEYEEGTVYFERKKMKIINFKISLSRARNVEFKKVK